MESRMINKSTRQTISLFRGHKIGTSMERRTFASQQVFGTFCRYKARSLHDYSILKRHKSSRTRIDQRYSKSRVSKFALESSSSSKAGVIHKEVEHLPSDVRLKNHVENAVNYFLPKGFPNSVGDGYQNYIKMQAVAMLFSTTGGVLSMQSMLYAIGVGSGSVPLAATLNWIIKDGLGQLGGVIFASVVSNRFDADPKRWRMVASGSMDVASFIELLTPVFPHLFLPLASVANVGKNISFLAASASRAAAHRAFATHENLADITAKAGSQSILCSMLGTGLGISVATAIGSISGGDSSMTYSLTLAAFGLCSAVNLSATYSSLTHVTLTTLNPGRLDFVFGEYLRTGKLMLPREFASREEYLGVPSMGKLVDVEIGPDVSDAAACANHLESALTDFAEEHFVIVAQRHQQVKDNEPVARVNILFKDNAEDADLVEGLCHAFLARRALRKAGFSRPASLGLPLVEDASAVKGVDQWQDMALPKPSPSELSSIKNFMIGLGLKSEGNEVSEVNERKDSTAVIKAPSSERRNNYSSWHVEGLLLERRYARISVLPVSE